jgi:hypothetical protein
MLERLAQRAEALAELQSTMAPKTKTTPASQADIMRRMLAACAPSAKEAADDRHSRQVKKEARRKKAADRAARQRAYDAAVAADLRADEEHQRKIAAADQDFYRAVRAPWDRRFAQDEEPPEIGEISPNPSDRFGTQVETEGRAQRALVSQPPPRNGLRYASAYEDLGADFAAAGRKLRGEDSLPMTQDEVCQAEWALARRKLEAL